MLSQQQQSQSGSQNVTHPNNNMSYNNMHMPSVHKNMASAAPSSGYHIQNMKEEPNTGPNNYSNMVNGAGQEDMAVSIAFFKFYFRIKTLKTN